MKTRTPVFPFWVLFVLYFCLFFFVQDAQSTCSDVGSATGHSYHHQAGQHDNLNAFLEGANIHYQRVWELTSESTNVRVYGPQDELLLQSRRAKIAKYVAATAEVSTSSLITAS